MNLYGVSLPLSLVPDGVVPDAGHGPSRAAHLPISLAAPMAPPSHLPTFAEQGQLIGDLRNLIAARGFVPFVAAPILAPSPAHFPDRWRADVLGVERQSLMNDGMRRQ